MDIETTLRDAVEHAIVGEPIGPSTAGRARSAVMAALHRSGRRGTAQVRAIPGGVQVRVVLDPGTPRVREVRFQLG